MSNDEDRLFNLSSRVAGLEAQNTALKESYDNFKETVEERYVTKDQLALEMNKIDDAETIATAVISKLSLSAPSNLGPKSESWWSRNFGSIAKILGSFIGSALFVELFHKLVK